MSKAAQTPTLQQKEIIDSTSASVRVKAAAGAGKTFILVERYMRHILDEGLRPDQVLTITFTRKAAAEMKKRIVNRLRAAGRFEDAQIAETGPIQTIHSFCERLLRENALAAGLDPKYEVAEGVRSGEIILAEVREVLASDLSDEPNAGAYLRRMTGQPRYRSHSAYALVEDQVESVLSAFRSSGLRPEELRAMYQDPETVRLSQLEILAQTLPLEVLEQTPLTADVAWLQALRNVGKTTRIALPQWVRGSYVNAEEDRAAEQACGLAQLALAAWWRVRQTMAERQELDFLEMESRAERLLRTQPLVAARIRDQYRVVMVDEAQDVNPIQYRLLDALGIERELWVGDDRQSIYGFRQADVERFRVKMAGSEFKLSKNHRSDPGILRYVDALFGQMWGVGYEPMLPAERLNLDDEPEGFDGVEHWRVEKAAWKSIAALVEESLPTFRAGEIAVLVRSGRDATAMYDALADRGIPARILGGADRFYTRLEVRDLANTLRALADPSDDFALLAMLRSPMVGLSMDAIVQLAAEPLVNERLRTLEWVNPDDGDKVAQMRRWFDPLTRYADRLSAWEVLSEVYATSGYLEALARRSNPEQSLANVRKLLALATERPDSGPAEYAEHIREIQNLNHKEGDAPAGGDEQNEVSILTIHKAKGLEFPMVVIPGLYNEVTRRAPAMLADPRTGLVGMKVGRAANLVHEFLSRRQQERDFDEELRVLYVAMTRAERRLCVCLYPRGSGRETFSSKLEAHLSSMPRRGIVERG